VILTRSLTHWLTNTGCNERAEGSTSWYKRYSNSSSIISTIDPLINQSIDSTVDSCGTESLFVGHAADEILGAQKLGMRTVLFASPDDAESSKPEVHEVIDPDAVIHQFAQLVSLVKHSRHFSANADHYKDQPQPAVGLAAPRLP